MALRIAAGLSMNASPEHRWRRVAVPASALLFMLLLLASKSALLMADRQVDRDAARSFEISTEAASTDLFLEVDKDIWRGQRIGVAWVEPAEPDGRPILPPGMEQFPAPGQSVVSPELDRLADSDPGLAKRYPNRLVLADAGLRSGDELIAYVRPPAGRAIGGESEAVRIEDGKFVGQGPVVRVSSFGHGVSVFLGDQTPWWQLSLGAVGMGVLPGMVVLAVGLAAASGVRDHRFQVLAALGARRRTVWAIAVLESLLLAVPGLIAAVVVWWLVAPRLRIVPVVGHRLVAGDLALPGWLLVAELGLAVALCVVVSIAILGLRRNSSALRATSDKAGLSRLAAVPLIVSFVAFVMAGIATGNLRLNLNALGTVCAVAGAPLVVPAVLRAVGAVVGRSRSVTTCLAGRWMEWNPKRAARPFVGLAGLVVLVIAGAGYFTVKDELFMEVPGPSSVGVEGVDVRWRDVASGDLARFTAEVNVGLVVPYGSGSAAGSDGHGHGRSQRMALSLGASCPQMARLRLGEACDPKAPLTLSASTEHQLAEVISEVTGERVGQLRLVPREQLAGLGAAVVLDRSPLELLDEHVREAARSTLPAPYVDSAIFARQPRFSSVVGWVTAGIAAALIALTAACLISLVDRMLSARRRLQHLLNLGISPAQLTRVGATMFAMPYTVATLAGFSTGCAIAIRKVTNPGIPMPWSTIGVTLLAILGVGLLGTAALAALGTRDALREAE